MPEAIFVTAINRVKAAAGSTPVTTGAAAIAGGGSKPAKGYVTDRILAKGDVITIPKMEGEDIELWLDAPAVVGGQAVLHCIATVVRGGVKMAMPIFIGNFIKEVTDTDGTVHRNTVLDTTGATMDLVTAPANIAEQWNLLAGHTFEISEVQQVKTNRRNFKTMVAYEGVASIYTITMKS